MKRIILVSYSQQLAVLNSRRIRDIVRSPEYRAIFPHVEIREDKGSEKEWETTLGGGVRAVGIGSSLTGYGADLMTIDDPVKDAEEARSMVTLDNHWQWLTTTARTRLQPGGMMLIPMTRWANMDLAGRLMMAGKADPTADQWHVLHLPAIAGEGDPLGRKPGQALWPSAYSREDLLAVKALEERNFEALYQQNPQPEGSKKFYREDIRQKQSSLGGRKCRAWDLAITDNEDSDYCVGALVEAERLPVTESQAKILKDAKLPEPLAVHVHDIQRQRAMWPDQRALIIETALREPGIPVVVESVRMDLSAVQDLRKTIQAMGREFNTVRPKGDKVARKADLQVISRRGNFSITPAEWNRPLLDEFDNFPVWSHDDTVDAVEVGLTYLQKEGFAVSWV